MCVFYLTLDELKHRNGLVEWINEDVCCQTRRNVGRSAWDFLDAAAPGKGKIIYLNIKFMLK